MEGGLERVEEGTVWVMGKFQNASQSNNDFVLFLEDNVKNFFVPGFYNIFKVREGLN